MRKFLSFVLTVALLSTMCFSYVVIHGESSDTRYEGENGEYAETNKKSYGVGEAVIIKCGFTTPESKRMVVVYKDVDGDGKVSDGDVPVWHQGAGEGHEYKYLFPLTGAIIKQSGSDYQEYPVSEIDKTVFNGDYLLTFKVFNNNGSGKGNYTSSEKENIVIGFHMENCFGSGAYAQGNISVPETTVVQGNTLKVNFSNIPVIHACRENYRIHIIINDEQERQRAEKVLYALYGTDFEYVGGLEGTVEFDTSELDPGEYKVIYEQYYDPAKGTSRRNQITVPVTIEPRPTPQVGIVSLKASEQDSDKTGVLVVAYANTSNGAILEDGATIDISGKLNTTTNPNEESGTALPTAKYEVSEEDYYCGYWFQPSDGEAFKYEYEYEIKAELTSGDNKATQTATVKFSGDSEISNQ